MICDICQIGEIDTIGYSNQRCDKCGQPYPYEEGHFLLLTHDQLELLKKFYKASDEEKEMILEIL